MAWYADLSEIVVERASLAAFTSFGLGGPARWFSAPRTIEQVGQLVRRCRSEEIELLVLGLGANVLIADDGVDATVVRLNAPGFKSVCWPAGFDLPTGAKGNGKTRAAGSNGSAKHHVAGGNGSVPKGTGPVEVTVGAGVDMYRLVLDSVRRGLRGLEGLAGIPGTLGGIIRMNAGGRWGQIADVVRDVTVINEAGEREVLTREQVGFTYRDTQLGKSVICSATLTLLPDDPAKIRDDFTTIWEAKSCRQPLRQPSAGCVFKNPPGQSAGALIELAGLKGRSIGGAQVSMMHGNFIVAREGATAADVFALIQRVQQEVAAQFGVELAVEIKLWGRHPAPLSEPVH